MLFICIALLFRLYSSAVYTVCETAKAQFASYASAAFYGSVGELLSDSVADGLTERSFDKDGNIVYIGTNAAKVNLFCHKLADRTLDSYEKYLSKGVSVPIGSFSGIKMLSGLGKNVNVETLSVVNVVCDFYGEYQNVGINQTRQQLYIVLKPEYTFVMPFYTQNGQFEIKYLLYDVLIVGKVPEFYIS